MEPHSLVGGTGEGDWSGRGLACGLKDQRLMARQPARAGGRSGLLSGGKVETRTVTLCLLPKGTPPRPQPAQPVGGPLRAFQCEGRRPGIPSEVQPPPHHPTREGGPGGGTSSPGGSFPHFFPRNGAPAGQAKVPCRSNGVRKDPQWPPPGRAPFPPVPTAQKSPQETGSRREIPPRRLLPFLSLC